MKNAIGNNICRHALKRGQAYEIENLHDGKVFPSQLTAESLTE